VVQVPPASTDAKRLQYTRIVSAGPDGDLTTPLDNLVAGMQPDGTAPMRGDDIVIFLQRADFYEPDSP
jgi:hypothetical protein